MLNTREIRYLRHCVPVVVPPPPLSPLAQILAKLLKEIVALLTPKSKENQQLSEFNFDTEVYETGKWTENEEGKCESCQHFQLETRWLQFNTPMPEKALEHATCSLSAQFTSAHYERKYNCQGRNWRTKQQEIAEMHGWMN